VKYAHQGNDFNNINFNLKFDEINFLGYFTFNKINNLNSNWNLTLNKNNFELKEKYH